MKPGSDTIDLAEIASALRGGVRWIVAGTLLGGFLAWGVTQLMVPVYESDTTVLVRDVNETPAMPQGGGFSGLFSGNAVVDTEVKILTSRTLLAGVVDSLGLQARLLKPKGVSSLSVFSSVRIPERTAAGGKYDFERSGNGYRVTGKSFSAHAVPGVPFTIRDAVLTIGRKSVPDEFRVEILDMQDAVDVVRSQIRRAGPAGGETVEVIYRAPDSLTAAAVPNAMVGIYLGRRKTSDRGVNQHRFEFLSARADSVSAELLSVESQIRNFQERYGVFDPEEGGKADLGRAKALQIELEGLEVETSALKSLTSAVAAGKLSAREVAAYPTFLRNGAINGVLSQLIEQDAKRTALLQRRTEQDPEVVLTGKNIAQLEQQLISISTSYLSGLLRQQDQIRAELRRYQEAITGVPGGMQAMDRLTREARRLTEASLALQGQMFQSRLAAISEGGDVRQIDVAVPPKRPVLPRKRLNLAIGLMGGLVLGVVGALGGAYLGPRLRNPREVELATGVPAIAFDTHSPLLLGGMGDRRSLLVVPTGSEATSSVVAHRIAAIAGLQGESVVLADFEQVGAEFRPVVHSASHAAVGAPAEDDAGSLALELATDGHGGGYHVYRANGKSLRATLDDLESRFSVVVVALPGLEHPATAAVLTAGRSVILVARAGKITRSELQGTVGALERAGITTSGVILQNGNGSGDSRP